MSLLLDTGTGSDAIASTTTTTYAAAPSYEFTVGLDPTSTSEFDYVGVSQTTAQTGTINEIPTLGLPLRTTETAYLTSDANYRTRNIVGLTTSTTVKNSTGVPVAQSAVTYDEYDGSHYPLYSYGTIANWTDPGTTFRGNPTTSRNWLDTTNTWVERHLQFDQAGSPINSWDPKGNLSQIVYSSTYAHAYPTQTITAVPDPNNNGFGSNTSLVATRVYDPNTGLVVSTTDANNKTTTFEYNEPFNRPTRVNRPDGGRTTHNYVPVHQCGSYVQTETLLAHTQRVSLIVTLEVFNKNSSVRRLLSITSSTTTSAASSTTRA